MSDDFKYRVGAVATNVSFGPIQNAYLFYIGGHVDRPVGEQVHLIASNDEDPFDIPWPEDMTPKQAILAWAEAQR